MKFHFANIFFDQSKKEESEAILELKTEISEIASRLGNVNFQYGDPIKNFDRSKVKGVVARLLHVKDISAVTALEVRNSMVALGFCSIQ